MPINMAKLLEGLEKNLVKNFQEKCSKCKNVLEDFPEDHQMVVIKKKKVVICGDCYFNKFGKEIDRHPIGVPHRISRPRATDGPLD